MISEVRGSTPGHVTDVGVEREGRVHDRDSSHGEGKSVLHFATNLLNSFKNCFLFDDSYDTPRAIWHYNVLECKSRSSCHNTLFYANNAVKMESKHSLER